MKDGQSSNGKIVKIEDVDATLADLESGEISLSDLSPEAYNQLYGSPDVVTDEQAQDDDEPSKEIEPQKVVAEEVEAKPSGEPSGESQVGEPSKPEVVEPKREKTLAQKYYEKADMANTFRQKYETASSKLERLKTDPEFRREWLEREASLKQLEVPLASDGSLDIDRAPDALKQVLAKADRLEAELTQMRRDKQLEQEFAKQNEELSMIDADIKDIGVDMGESFAVADRKYAKIWEAFQGDVAKVDKFLNDPAFRKTMSHVEAPKDLDTYLKVAKSVHQMKALNGEVSLEILLQGNGLSPKQRNQAKANSDSPSKAEMKKTYEVQERPETIPASFGKTSIPHELDDGEFIDRISGMAVESLTKEQRDRVKRIMAQ